MRRAGSAAGSLEQKDTAPQCTAAWVAKGDRKEERQQLRQSRSQGNSGRKSKEKDKVESGLRGDETTARGPDSENLQQPQIKTGRLYSPLLCVLPTQDFLTRGNTRWSYAWYSNLDQRQQ